MDVSLAVGIVIAARPERSASGGLRPAWIVHRAYASFCALCGLRRLIQPISRASSSRPAFPLGCGAAPPTPGNCPRSAPTSRCTRRHDSHRHTGGTARSPPSRHSPQADRRRYSDAEGAPPPQAQLVAVVGALGHFTSMRQGRQTTRPSSAGAWPSNGMKGTRSAGPAARQQRNRLTETCVKHVD